MSLVTLYLALSIIKRQLRVIHHDTQTQLSLVVRKEMVIIRQRDVCLSPNCPGSRDRLIMT